MLTRADIDDLNRTFMPDDVPADNEAPVDNVPVIFGSAEEPENEMRRRLDRVARKRGIVPDDIQNLHFCFPEPDQCILGAGAPNAPIAATALFESLRQAAKDIRPALIIVD